MLYTCVQLFLFTLVLRYSSKQRIMSGSASTLLILNLLIHSDSLTDLPLNICERVTISVFTALVIVMKVTATSILVVLAMRVTITVFSADGIIIIIPSALNTVMVTLTQMFQFVVTRWYGLRFNSLPSTIPIDLNQIV